MTDKDFERNVKKMLLGDKDGLKEIYEAYNPMIYSLVYEITRNRQDAEDITSEFFIKLWNAADKFKKGRGHRAWLATVAHNMAVDFVRKNRREELLEEYPEDIQPAGKSQEEEICSNLAFHKMLDSLEEEERLIINLKLIGEMTFKEIAATLNRPIGTITWKYNKAVEKVRRCAL